MIYDALTPNQHYWQTISNWWEQVQEIVNESWAIVWYKPLPKEESNNTFWYIILFIMTISFLFFIYNITKND
jgi:hypothetical protein